MDKENKNPLVKKSDAIVRFDPKERKGLIVRGLNKLLSQKTILVVEDDKNANRWICNEIKNNFGDEIKAISFYDGKPAFEYLKNNLTEVDLITSCIIMPELDGIKLLRMVKELRPRLPFIIFSALDYPDDFAVWAAEAYIVKSVDLSELLNTIEKMLNVKGKEIFKLEREGINYLAAHKYEEAKETFLKLIDLDYKEVYYLLGYTYYCLHMYQEAIEAYNQDLKYNLGNMANTHYHIGLVYIVLEQKEKALEEYQILKKLDSKLAEKLFKEIYK
ncbi:MAG: response regulator [Thermodesulfovibrionales bacterium]|nr:response regulator [Thermodesulfovibrionales bacterium]